MKRSSLAFTVFFLLFVLVVAAVWYWSLGQQNSNPPTVASVPMNASATVQQPPVQQLPIGMYRDAEHGFTIILPTALASTSNPTLYSVDPSYSYTAKGPGKTIPGVKFTIPSTLATGTNLSNDTYVSVEHLPIGQMCDPAAFLISTPAKMRTLSEGGIDYLVASSSGAAAGNRYEEYVYAASSSNPCIAVRYFIHYGAIENFPKGTVKEFDRAALLNEFDQIRRTLTSGE